MFLWAEQVPILLRLIAVVNPGLNSYVNAVWRSQKHGKRFFFLSIIESRWQTVTVDSDAFNENPTIKLSYGCRHIPLFLKTTCAQLYEVLTYVQKLSVKRGGWVLDMYSIVLVCNKWEEGSVQNDVWQEISEKALVIHMQKQVNKLLNLVSLEVYLNFCISIKCRLCCSLTHLTQTGVIWL